MRPAVFGAYYDTVVAIGDDDLEEASRQLARLARWTPFGAREVVAYGSPDLAEDNALYHAKWDHAVSPLRAPSTAVASGFRTRLDDGFALMQTALPELYGEIDAILRQVVVIGKEPAAPMHVDGGSHYQLWGALFLNGEFHPDRIAVVEVLAHETAHCLLFGFCTEEPLVLNGDDELHPSPLRHDLRPMDGLYHATFVSARMHWAMTRLAEHSGLSEDERGRAREAAAKDADNFEKGYGVVATHGKLTERGAALMEGARSTMAEAKVAA